MNTPITPEQARFIEGYAAALDDVHTKLTGCALSAKSCDPMTVELETGFMHSYAFNMKDGGRHHPLKDYKDIDEIKAVLLEETLLNLNAGESHPGLIPL